MLPVLASRYCSMVSTTVGSSVSWRMRPKIGANHCPVFAVQELVARFGGKR